MFNKYRNAEYCCSMSTVSAVGSTMLLTANLMLQLEKRDLEHINQKYNPAVFESKIAQSKCLYIKQRLHMHNAFVCKVRVSKDYCL